jgi:CubicO group peptidase (beta-lactamase class C family)
MFMRFFVFVGLLYFTLPICAEDEVTYSAQGIDDVVIKFMERTKYSGLSIVAYKNYDFVFAKPYGFSNVESKTPFKVDELMALGSNVKTLVAASLMLLEEKKALKLTDNINIHLPFELHQADTVTIKDMLCHVSDLPDVFGGEFYEDYQWQKAKSQKEFIDKINESKRKILPQSEYRYNNTAYFLLGMVIEHISNQPLGDYFREQLFSPIHLDNAYYLGDSFYYPKLAKMYQVDGSKIIDYEDPVDYRVVAGAGAQGGDIKSYAKLFTEILTGSVLSNKSKVKMKTPCVLDNGTFVVNGKKQKIGLGIEISRIDSQNVFSRGGAMNGHVSAIYHFEKTGLTMAIVGNTFMRLAPVLDSIFEKKLHLQFN